MRWTPNRIVAGAVSALGVLTLVVGLAADLGAPAAAVAIGAGALTLLTPAVVWLKGWQAHEARQGEGDQPVGWDDLHEALGALGSTVGAMGAQLNAQGERLAVVADATLGTRVAAVDPVGNLVAAVRAAPAEGFTGTDAVDPVDEDDLEQVASQPPTPEDLVEDPPDAVDEAERGAP